MRCAEAQKQLPGWSDALGAVPHFRPQYTLPRSGSSASGATQVLRAPGKAAMADQAQASWARVGGPGWRAGNFIPGYRRPCGLELRLGRRSAEAVAQLDDLLLRRTRIGLLLRARRTGAPGAHPRHLTEAELQLGQMHGWDPEEAAAYRPADGKRHYSLPTR